ncbi:MAG: insulinase family protein [Alphaproteobacteria bacterium]|nr:insulinase family protein [Alphaproteobacteria bacterium]
MIKKILLVFVFCSFAFIKSANAELFKAHEFFLSNGLHVVVVENHKAPLVKQMLFYKTGAVNDGLGKGGRAHFLEHLMFRGTDKIKDGKLNELLENNGVSNNAFTGYEVTAFHEFADISKLELLLAIEADRMRNLNFDEKAFTAEKQVVIEERKQVVENNPAAPFMERFRQMIWGNTPFGRPITGLKEEIEALSFADVKDFYNQYYAPNNAVLVLSGDIGLNEAKPLVEKYFGAIKNPPIKASYTETPVLNEKFSQRLKMNLPHIQTPKIIWRFILPPYTKLSGNPYDYDVLAEYLGSGDNSALYRDLVIKQKIALSVSADFSFISASNSVFSLSLIPADGIKISDAEKELNEALRNAIEKFDAQKLASIKKKMLADLVYVNDNPADSANMIGYMLATGFSLDDVQNYEQNIENVSLKGVKNAYHEVFYNSAKAVGILLPENGVEE